MNAKGIIVISALLMIVVGPILAFDVAEGTETREGEGSDPYCTFSINVQSGDYSIGGEVEFIIYVRNEYDGEQWTDPETSSARYYLLNAKLSILYTEATDGDGNKVDIFEEASPESLKPDNNDGEGYDIHGSGSYYYFKDDSTSSPLALRIKSTGVKGGEYRLPLALNFQVALSNPADPQLSAPITQNGYVTMMVNSNIQGLSDEADLVAEDQGYNVPVYAGAKYIVVRTPYVRPQYGKILEDVQVVLTFDDPYFMVERNQLSFETMSYSNGRYFKWRICVSPNAAPKEYKAKIVLDYNLQGEPIEEGPYIVTLRVEPTPFISFPDTDNMTAPTVTTVQKTGSCNIGFQIVNAGNVDLSSVKVRLDLDSALHLRLGRSYFDEGSYSHVVATPPEKIFESMPRGDKVDVLFEDVKVDRMLPPGDYLVPIDYSAAYNDPFDESGAMFPITTYQWDEIGQEDHVEINMFRYYPRKMDILGPHIMLRVNDDIDGPDIFVKTRCSLERGSRDAVADIVIENHELFPLKDVTYTLRSPDPKIVCLHGSKGTVDVIAEGSGVLPEAEPGNPGRIIVHAEMDVTTNKSSPGCELILDMSGYDLNGEFVELNFTVPVDISSRPAKLELTQFSTTEIIPGEEFEVTLGILNTGGTGVAEYSLILCSESNRVSTLENKATGFTLGPGETGVHVFKCVASEDSNSGGNATMKILVSLVDDNGMTYDFDEFAPKSVGLSLPDSPEKEETDLTIIGLYLMIGIVLASLFLSIAIAFSVVTLSRTFGPRGERTEAKKEEKKTELKEEATPVKSVQSGGSQASSLEQDLPAPKPAPFVQPSLPSPHAERDPLLDDMFGKT